MKRVQSFLVFCACVFTVIPTRAYSQAANDSFSRDKTVDSIGDEVVADVLNGVEGVAQDSARAAVAEARRDATNVESALRARRTLTPTSAPDSDESIGRDIEKLEALSQE
jgi:hypothetical protein